MFGRKKLQERIVALEAHNELLRDEVAAAEAESARGRSLRKKLRVQLAQVEAENSGLKDQLEARDERIDLLLGCYNVVEELHKQRDQWRDRWRQEGQWHTNAQVLLEGELAKARRGCAALLAMLNRERKELSKEPIVMQDMPNWDDNPIGSAIAFKKQLAAQIAEMDAQIVAKLEAAVTEVEVPNVARKVVVGRDGHFDILAAPRVLPDV